MKKVKRKRIGVKFCGSCNPVWNMAGFFEELKKQPNLIFVPFLELPYDLLLVLHGCKKSCTFIPDFNGDIVMMDDSFITDSEGAKHSCIGRDFKLLIGELCKYIKR